MRLLIEDARHDTATTRCFATCGVARAFLQLLSLGCSACVRKICKCLCSSVRDRPSGGSGRFLKDVDVQEIFFVCYVARYGV